MASQCSQQENIVEGRAFSSKGVMAYCIIIRIVKWGMQYPLKRDRYNNIAPAY